MATRTPTAQSPRVGSLMYRILLVVAVFSLSCVMTNLHAGEVSFAVDKVNNKLFLTFTGDIESGDAEKIKSAIETHRYFYLWSNGLVIDSNGGDVVEAIKIGNLVERSGWRVDVQKGSVCASACFLIYVAAPIKYSEGKIVIHRPYFLMNKAEGKDAYQIGKGYRATISEVRSYLSAQLVPGYLIDLMMSKDSSQGYTLTQQDIINIGFYSPAVDEYQVQKCNFPTNHLAGKAELDKVSRCTDEYLLQARIKFLYGKKYPEAAKAVAQVVSDLSALPEKFPLGSTEYNDSLLNIQHVVNTLPPSEWASALRENIGSHVVEQ